MDAFKAVISDMDENELVEKANPPRSRSGQYRMSPINLRLDEGLDEDKIKLINHLNNMATHMQNLTVYLDEYNKRGRGKLYKSTMPTGDNFGEYLNKMYDEYRQASKISELLEIRWIRNLFKKFGGK